jgi:hypothetical protein
MALGVDLVGFDEVGAQLCGQRQDIFGEHGQTQSVLPDLIGLYPSECIFR